MPLRSFFLFTPVVSMQAAILLGDLVETLHAAQSGELVSQASEVLQTTASLGGLRDVLQTVESWVAL